MFLLPRTLPIMTKSPHFLAACLLVLDLSGGGSLHAAAEKSLLSRPNVLMIVVDDLNDMVGSMGGRPAALTPNLDRLAARGTLFANAHCQAPLCNPSRTSVLSGLRPTTTGIYGLKPGPRAVPALADWVMLPQAFAQAGYFTASFGKVWHDGAIPPEDRAREFEVFGPAPGEAMPPSKIVTTPSPMRDVDWGSPAIAEHDYADWKTADNVLTQLAAAPRDRPFFIAAGFRLPHLPCFAPAAWFELYPVDKMAMPPVFTADRADVPDFAWYLHWKIPEPRLSWLEQNQQWAPLVRAYLASTSFMDSQIGRVIEGLAATGHADDTVIVLWSDNGWHLGEKGITGKLSLWERSTRVPLVFAGPGVTPGQVCQEPAELLDIYPTLLAVTGLPPRPGLEGHSLLPQLRDASSPRPWPAITTSSPDNHSIRSTRWRYIRYANGSDELYDLVTDRNEWTNLVADPHYAGIRSELAAWLPAVSAALAPGSANRILVRDGDHWLWDGQPITPERMDPSTEGPR